MHRLLGTADIVRERGVFAAAAGARPNASLLKREQTQPAGLIRYSQAAKKIASVETLAWLLHFDLSMMLHFERALHLGAAVSKLAEAPPAAGPWVAVSGVCAACWGPCIAVNTQHVRQ